MTGECWIQQSIDKRYSVLARSAWMLWLLLSALLAMLFLNPAHAANVPVGFADRLVATGLNSPTSMSVLPDGRVLVVGGAMTPRGARSSAELFDPEQGTWTDAGRLQQARHGHRAIMLNDGRVLIVGGYYVWKYLASCEVYSP